MVRRERLSESTVPAVADTGAVAVQPRAAQTSAQFHHEGAEAGDALGSGQALGAGDGERERVREHDAPVVTEGDVDVLADRDAEVRERGGRNREAGAVAGSSDAAEVAPRVTRRARGGSVVHSMSKRVIHLDGESSTATSTARAHGKLVQAGRMWHNASMPRATTATLPKRVRKMTQRQAAVHAANVRWANERAKHYDALHRLRARVITAESDIAAMARELPTDQRGAVDVALAHLVGGFHELWKFSGHDLPAGMRDYAAGVIDELRRQAALREGDQV